MRLLVLLWLCLVAARAQALELTHSPAEAAVVETSRPTVTVYLPITLMLPPDRAHLWVNGEDVTDQCQSTKAYVSFRPASDLPAGNCTVRFSLEPYDQTWTFQVKPRPLSISKVEVVAPVNVTEFDTVDVRMTAQPQQSCYFEVDGAPGQRPLVEESPGHYAGQFTIPGGFPKLKLRVTGFLRKGAEVESKSAGPVLLSSAGFRLILTEPQSDVIQGEELHLIGKTRPNVEVRYQAQLVFRDGIETGSVPKAKWEKVRSDSSGGFVILYKKAAKLPRLDLLVTLLAEDADGNRSQPIGLHLKYDDSQPLYNPIRVDKQ